MSDKDTESLGLDEEIYLSGKRETEFMGQQQWRKGSRHDCHRVSRLTKDYWYLQRGDIEFTSLLHLWSL